MTLKDSRAEGSKTKWGRQQPRNRAASSAAERATTAIVGRVRRDHKPYGVGGYTTNAIKNKN